MDQWKRNLYFLWAGTFLSSVGINMIIPFLPFYVHDLGVTDVKKAALWAAFIFAGNHFMIALSSPVWGRLSDKYGQKLMMLRSGLGMGVVIIAMGFVRTPLELLLLRMTMGLVAGFITAASTFQAIETPKEHVGRALGVLQTGNVSGSLLGPMFGGLLAETVGIRNAFYLTGSLLLVSTVLITLGVKETRAYEKVRLFGRLRGGSSGSAGSAGSTGRAGNVGSIGSVGSTGRAGNAGSVGSVGSTGRAGSIGSVGSTGGAGSVSSVEIGVGSGGPSGSGPAVAQAPALAAAKPKLLEAVKQTPVIATLFFSTFLISGSFQSIEPIITLYVKSMHIQNHVALIGGIVYAASALGTIVAAPFLGKLGDRFGSHIVLMFALLAVSVLYIPQAWIDNPWLLLANRFVLGLSVGGLVPSVSSLLRSLSPERGRGGIFGFNQSAGSLGNVCGALFGGFMANHWGIPSIFLCLSAIFFFHFVLVWVQWKTGAYTGLRRQESGRRTQSV